MNVEIISPPELNTPEKKRGLLEVICEWGETNLEDQIKWKYVRFLIQGVKLTSRTVSISFDMENEEDAMALKLTWC